MTGVLIARATGMSFGEALRERICGPLGMKDTGFSVGGQSISRLATVYLAEEFHGEIAVEDGPSGYWSRPPAFEDGGGGLVSTSGTTSPSPRIRAAHAGEAAAAKSSRWGLRGRRSVARCLR
jgi:CubicO group peptidase (beta-lactamase class C family)